jgi:cyanophycin synthetase
LFGLLLVGFFVGGCVVWFVFCGFVFVGFLDAMGMAEEGTFITALSDVISNAIDLVQDYQARELMEDDKNS